VMLRPGHFPFAHMLTCMRVAEDAGFEFMWFGDSHLIWHEVSPYLAAAAAATRLTVGPLVSNPVTRHPTVMASMMATIAQHGPGSTKAEITETLRREEVNRGLTFEYCLIAAGNSHNRAPSPQRWEKGDVLSLDSGANYHGYIGDLARMAILGEPDAELEDLLGEIETIQRAAFKPIKAGAMGGEIYAAGEALVAKSKQHNNMEFLAHGMGLVSHEAPHLTNSGPVPYTDEDAHRPLEAGTVISVETTLKHPTRGFIKLEDTVAVTDSGFEIFGEGGRGWNRGGTARQ